MIALYLNIHGILRNITLSSNFFCRKRRKKLFDASKTAFLLLKRTKRDNRKSTPKSTGREKEKRKKKACKTP
jgi:hypothetical protein